MCGPLSRRDALAVGAAGLALAAAPPADRPPDRPFLTAANHFQDVSRGKPVPHSLEGDALDKARLTPGTWRLDITAEPRVSMRPKSFDFKALLALGKKRPVRYLKAMQCNNIALPLGQGLWEGVLLRDVLAECGPIDNARRLFYWGFHNDKPEQMFRSSLAWSQVLDAPPGDMPPFLAYRLNGEEIPLIRGGPVRMVVPWAHGFKSIKWLQRIVATNDFKTNDTYADANNDPESYQKTAAYFDDPGAVVYRGGRPIIIHGTAMVGWPGLARVEYWLRPDAGKRGKLPDGDPAWAKADWQPASINPPPKDWTVPTKGVWGFDDAGRPREWPMRFSVALWTLWLGRLKPGKYELRVRSVDRNGFAQPQPRPGQRSGRNLIQCKLIEVA
jgi:DMSO/TMAO reductase YedYZ molybdopterin-dependent catalytic subunit